MKTNMPNKDVSALLSFNIKELTELRITLVDLNPEWKSNVSLCIAIHKLESVIKLNTSKLENVSISQVVLKL